METKTYYRLERYISKESGWVEEGIEFDDLKEAIAELKFHRTLFPEEKWRIAQYAAKVIYAERI